MSSMAASRNNLYALRDMVHSKIKSVLCAYDHSFSFAAVEILDVHYISELAKSCGWGGLSCK